jgi:N-acetylglutamate synthase-like GNAT family acetyltransferase
VDDGIKIRVASADDLDFLAEQVYISAEIVRHKIGSGEFMIAEREGKVVGFLQLEYLWSLVPYIALIRVVPAQRRRGIGKRMVEWLEDLLRENGYKTLYSSSQSDEPEPQAWHRHIGFEECGFIAGINDGTDEIFFRKILWREELDEEKIFFPGITCPDVGRCG